MILIIIILALILLVLLFGATPVKSGLSVVARCVVLGVLVIAGAVVGVTALFGENAGAAGLWIGGIVLIVIVAVSRVRA